jgi:dTDP-4-amino-4,6-dideoxygalactose transaminase/pyrrolidone-carboxylate peptidase
MMILVTGSEPYDGSTENPSRAALERLPDEIRGIKIIKLCSSCDSQHTPARVAELANDPVVKFVLVLGEDRRYKLPTIERVAYNWLDYDVPDNRGRRPRNVPIVPGGPESFTTSLDANAVQQALASQGIMIDVSDDPGRHLCNQIYYTVRYHTDPKTAILFHLPRFPTQQASPSLPFDESFRAILGLLEQLVTLEGGLMDSNEDVNAELSMIQEAFRGVLQHRQYVLGPEVKQLEDLLASWLKTRFAVGCNSGFGAYLISLLSLGLGKSSRVAISAFAPASFIGTLLRQGATPVVVDVAPNDFHMNPAKLVNKLDGTINTIVVHHLFGGAADIPAIVGLAGDIPTIEVLTYSLGARIGQDYIGTFGTLATSCLREQTTIGAYGDAGMIWTNNAELNERIRRIRAENARTGIHEGFVSGNFHQDTVHAAILFRKFDEWLKRIEERNRRALYFAREIKGRNLEQVTVPDFYQRHATYFVFLAKQRDALIDHLRARGTAATIWWPMPIYSQPGFYQLGHKKGDFPEAERIAETNINLHLPETEGEAARLADELAAFYRK